jgi:hypothetical protein
MVSFFKSSDALVDLTLVSAYVFRFFQNPYRTKVWKGYLVD